MPTPHSTPRRWTGSVLVPAVVVLGLVSTACGREAIEEMRKALVLDPLSAHFSRWLGRFLLYAERYDAAIEQSRKTLEIEPTYFQAYLDIGASLLAQGKAEDALEEYDSLETVDAIARAIEVQHHSVVKLGGGREFLNNILGQKVDLVFNIAEGLGNYRSREAQVPSVLEMLGLPYSGSDPLCLALTLEKPLAKRQVSFAGVATPRWQVIGDAGQLKKVEWDQFPLPAFAKPAHEGSSKGIRSDSKVFTFPFLKEKTEWLLKNYGSPVLVEEFVKGPEFTVGILGNDEPSVIGVMQIEIKGIPPFESIRPLARSQR